MTDDGTDATGARMYNYAIGGKDHLTPSRKAMQSLIEVIPDLPGTLKANKEFGIRAAVFAAEQDVRQFVDLGCGLPLEPYVHDKVREVVPDARVAYVDNQRVVAAHARALLLTGPGLHVTEADITEPQVILADLKDTIDFSQPVCLLLCAVLHFVPSPLAESVVREYRNLVAPGSYIAISHATADGMNEDEKALADEVYGGAEVPMHFRSREEIEQFFEGLELVDRVGGEPAITDVVTWGRISSRPRHRVLGYGAMAVKPG